MKVDALICPWCQDEFQEDSPDAYRGPDDEGNELLYCCQGCWKSENQQATSRTMAARTAVEYWNQNHRTDHALACRIGDSGFSGEFAIALKKAIQDAWNDGHRARGEEDE